MVFSKCVYSVGRVVYSPLFVASSDQELNQERAASKQLAPGASYTQVRQSEKGDRFGRPTVNFYADERTRTSTRLLPQRPERCASTSSATSALEAGILLAG